MSADHKPTNPANPILPVFPPARESQDSANSAPQSTKFDVDAIRARLAQPDAPHHWQSLEQLQDTKQFRNFMENEFPANADAADPERDHLTRRDALKVMAASAALAGLSACTKLPAEKIVPYVRAPEEIIPGKPLFFATAMPLQGVATGLLVESHMGRPTKIEGNPDHPGSLGSTDALMQASVLDLYDPDRSQTVYFEGRISNWNVFAQQMGDLRSQLAPKGTGVRILTETVSSPTLAAQIHKLLQQFPDAKWHQYEPCGGDSAREGARMAFGKPVNTVYRFDQARVIVSLDSDFLLSSSGHVRHTRDFAARRAVEGPQSEMSRLYVVESMPTSTGATADHRLPMRSSEVEAFARFLAAAIGISVADRAAAPLPAKAANWLAAVARDLQSNRGKSIVIAGETQPPLAHALAHAINDALGNVGKTLYYTESLEANPVNQSDSLWDLVKALNSNEVKLLLILGGNPVYDAPADLNFGSALLQATMRVHCGAYRDETAELCHWHVPGAHYLESWGDARAYDGTVSIIQPLIAPLYDGHTHLGVVATLTDDSGKSAHDLVQQYWQSQRPEKGKAFEQFWERSLHDGLMANTALPAITVQLHPDFARQFGGTATNAAPNELELVFRPDPTILDGRFANNSWLQETPKPITRLTWDNAALMSPNTAAQYKLAPEDYVTLKIGGRELKAGVFVVPGHADNSVTLHLGYGRWRVAGSQGIIGPGGSSGVGTRLGFNAYALRASAAPWIMGGLQIEKTGDNYSFAAVQHQYAIDFEGHSAEDESRNAFRRDLVQVASLDQFRRDPNFAKVPETQENHDQSLYPDFKYTGYAWGMSIDLNRCVGCNACVVACQSENNIAVVGKDQVIRGRSMHWIRIDTYFDGNLETPAMYFEPLPCMQCENAPCEYVCPVGATTHSPEGLNEMTYNRCVGTRYCSNNCPYKVRRFNFYLYSDYKTPSLYGLRNPNVTVRSRGVMEKCTYCVQRINVAKITSEEEDRLIRDGEIQTACQQACPAQAIVFGNINDKKSQVSKLKAQSRDYVLLADLNTRPRTSYLARIRNPNPEIHESA